MGKYLDSERSRTAGGIYKEESAPVARYAYV